MSVTPPPHDPSPSPKRKTSGVLLAFAVAVIVFGLGNLLVTSFNRPVELPPAPAIAGHAGGVAPSLASTKIDAAPSQPASADGGLENVGAGDGSVKVESPLADAGTTTTARGETPTANGAARLAEPSEKTEPGEGAEKSDDEAATRRPGGAGDCGPVEKDIAREAWRRNIPTICLTGTGKAHKTTLYLPLKGNVADATYDYRPKTRVLRIISPNASSLLTMVQYKLRRHGFKELKVANEGNGVKYRLILEKGAAEPLVELKETFIKVVLPVPTSEGE